MSHVSIQEDRFRQALFNELPGLAYMYDSSIDMLDLRFTFRVTHGLELLRTEAEAYEQVKLLAERLRQEVLVKTGASRIVQAANDQAEQYRQENVRMGRMLQERDDAIKELKARITDLQDQLTEEL